MPILNFPYKRPFYNLTLTPQEINVCVCCWLIAGMEGMLRRLLVNELNAVWGAVL